MAAQFDITKLMQTIPGLDVPNLKNSKGHGFNCFLYDGLFLFAPPTLLLKGKSPIAGLQSIKEAAMKDDDVIICAYPKCGTHWLWEVIEMLKSGVIEYRKETKETRMIEIIYKDGIDAIPTPRVLNTHLPLRMLPKQVVEKKVKCIQIMRNPKDVCVSYFNHYRNMVPPLGYEGDFAEFTEAFVTGKLCFGSYYNYLLTWKAELAGSPAVPVLDLVYEDMKHDPVKSVKDVARFLGLTTTDQFCEDVAFACSFKKMKQIDKDRKLGTAIDIWREGSEGTFYRKGEIGDWKNWFTVAESERFDQMWNKKMKDSGFKFTYTPV
ncbi:sulfotransferase 1B1-like isoform X1 [Haliotis rufescens]|uniref:sulfotransferase 1B1-like isoform X1 n=2 Tax=Haliotis rufescens TaxID=6454 RepID=UPI00201EF5C9|nr:sulfotransferase 1B1-like isoform X1 [Haliotis rufescens]